MSVAPRWRRSRRFRAVAIPAIAVAFVVVTWYPSPPPAAGFDPSWQIALHLIADRGLDFGTDVIFPYGPLGFLLFPQVVAGGTWSLAFLATLALRGALVALVIVAARRACGHLLPALVVGYLCAALLGPLVTIPGLLAVLTAMVMLQRPVDRDSPIAAYVAPAAGVGAGLCLLVKLDAGTIAILTLGMAAMLQGRRGWRSAAGFVAGLAGSVVAGWLATGNSLVELPRWLRLSTQVVSGYSEGAAFTDQRLGPAWHLVAFACLVIVAALLTARSTEGVERGRRIAIGGVLVAALWVEFKHGFVRHDTHVVGTFAAVGLLALMLRPPRRALGWSALAVATVGVGLAIVSMNVERWSRLEPTGLAGFGREARLLVDASARHRAIRDARADVRRDLAIDPAIIDAIGTRTVHVAPQETSAVWADDLTWRPIPQFQSFSTWTAELDRVNAHALASADGPQLVLWEDVARLDDHNPLFESPAENLALICDFRRVRMIGRWELRERAAGRCGPPRAVATVRPGAGGMVTIPPVATDEILTARIRWSPSIVERLRTLAYRPSALPEITLPAAPKPRPYRIPRTLLGGPLILRVPRYVNLPSQLRLLVDGDRMVLGHMPGATVEFVARRVSTGARTQYGAGRG